MPARQTRRGGGTTNTQQQPGQLRPSASAPALSSTRSRGTARQVRDSARRELAENGKSMVARRGTDTARQHARAAARSRADMRRVLATCDALRTSVADKYHDTKSMFRSFDEDKDGSISVEDILYKTRDNKLPFSEDDLRLAVKHIDTSNSGVIEFDEFCALFDPSKFPKPGPEGIPSPRAAGAMVQLNDLLEQHQLQTKTSATNDQKLKNAVRHADPCSTGVLSRERFRQLMGPGQLNLPISGDALDDLMEGIDPGATGQVKYQPLLRQLAQLEYNEEARALYSQKQQQGCIIDVPQMRRNQLRVIDFMNKTLEQRKVDFKEEHAGVSKSHRRVPQSVRHHSARLDPFDSDEQPFMPGMSPVRTKTNRQKNNNRQNMTQSTSIPASIGKVRIEDLTSRTRSRLEAAGYSTGTAIDEHELAQQLAKMSLEYGEYGSASARSRAYTGSARSDQSQQIFHDLEAGGVGDGATAINTRSGATPYWVYGDTHGRVGMGGYGVNPGSGLYISERNRFRTTAHESHPHLKAGLSPNQVMSQTKRQIRQAKGDRRRAHETRIMDHYKKDDEIKKAEDDLRIVSKSKQQMKYYQQVYEHETKAAELGAFTGSGCKRKVPNCSAMKQNNVLGIGN